MTYNLLDEEWIPVLFSNGRAARVGIKRALLEAGRIRQIAATNPMDNVALLRFVLALLYWCKGNPPEGWSASPGNPVPANWLSKLDDNKDCFELLGTGKRFYQVSNARRARAITDLIQEIPTGNNFWHFRHSTDDVDGLCPACCAMGLVRLPLFSVSGLPNLKAGINGTPPVYVVPWGRSLWETLIANWSPCRLLGSPAWVQPDIRPTPEQDVPLLTGLTLLSRRVWLHDASGPRGQCVGCGGSEARLIRTCEFETAGQQKNERWNDPHVVYSEGSPRKASKAADLTTAGKFRMDRPWIDLLFRILETGKVAPRDKPSSLFVVAFATDQAKNIDVWERVIELPSASSFQAAATSAIQKWQREGWRLEKRTEQTIRSEDLSKTAIATIRPCIENRVSTKTDELLAGGEGAWDQAAAEYRPMMKMLAKSLSPGFTTAAVHRRNQIVNVLPDMRTRVVSAKKSSRQKGGASERNGAVH
jgi:CRISPR type I-E-associated protein CasA/Cse1